LSSTFTVSDNVKITIVILLVLAHNYTQDCVRAHTEGTVRQVINKSLIQKLSDKEMDRKDFLKYSGVILAGVVGLKGILSLVSQADKQPTALQSDQASRGFGSGKYGA
jgi:hypothetical protein